MARKQRRESFKGANGTGTIYERPNGRWQGQVSIGRKADGTLRRLSKTFVTKNEAAAWVRRMLVAAEDGALLEPGRITVSDLVRHWGESNPQWSAASQADNIGTLARHALPIIGHLLVRDLTPNQVQAMVNELRLKPAAWPPKPEPKEGEPVPAPNPPLSEAMIRRVLARLRACLNHGVRMNVLVRNPALGVALPKVERVPRDPWTLDEAQVVLAYCAANPSTLHHYFYVAIMTGLRKQELRGLTWDAVSLDRGELVVRQVAVDAPGGVKLKAFPKTAAGYRVVDFDAGTAEVLERQRKVSGAAGGLVFPSETGRPLDSGVLRRALARLVGETGVPQIRLYDTRATHGTLLAEAGVNPKVLSERLGHTDVAFSMRTYVRPGRAEHKSVAAAAGLLLQPAATEPDLTVGERTADNSEKPMNTQSVTAGDSS